MTITTSTLNADNCKRGMSLQLPPSVNELYINRKGSYKRILTDEGRDYIYTYSHQIKSYLNSIQHEPIDFLFHLDIDWWLPNRNCDSHNFEKALFDMLEKAGFVKDDKYIMARTHSVQYSKEAPRVFVSWKGYLGVSETL